MPQLKRAKEESQELQALLAQAWGEELIAHCVTAPLEVSCTQGAHRYPATRVAVSGNAALFLCHETRQFGSGLCGRIPGVVEEAYQYPGLRVAILMFLELARREA